MSPELLSLEEEIASLKEELIRVGSLKEEQLIKRRLEQFVPNPKQYQFFVQAATRLRAGFCGNRFGKSTLGVVEDCCWLIGERPFFPVGHPLRTLGIPIHGVKGLVVAEDWDKVHELFTNTDSADRPGKFFEFLSPDVVKGTTREQKGRINSITVKTTLNGKNRESIVIFDTVRSYWNNPKSFESSDWDFIHIDEPVPQELWTAVSRGLLDRGGYSWWLLTPLGFPWMYDTMVEQAALSPRTHWYFEASMDDNPLLDDVAKALYVAGLTADERECRVLGKPLAYGRRVYGHYDEKVHLWSLPTPPPGWRDFTTPPKSHLCGYSLDPHPQTPHTVLFTAIAPNGDVYFYDELFEKCLIRELADRIIEKRDKVRCGWEICDPCAWIENPDTGSSWADTLHEKGLYVTRASKDKTNGIIATQEIWGPKYPNKVWVMPHMTRFRKEIKSYFFDRENKPVDKNDHIMECLYRTVVQTGLGFFAETNVGAPIFARDEFAKVSYDIGYMKNINI